MPSPVSIICWDVTQFYRENHDLQIATAAVIDSNEKIQVALLGSDSNESGSKGINRFGKHVPRSIDWIITCNVIKLYTPIEHWCLPN